MKSLNQYINEKHWPHTQLAEGKDTKQWLVSGRTKPGFWEVHILKADELEEFLGHDGFVSALALDFLESTTVLNPDTSIRWAVTKL